MNITDEQLKSLMDGVEKSVNDSMEKNLEKAVGPMVAKQTRDIVEKMRIERSLFGSDRSGLDEEQKKEFAGIVKSIAFGKTKANEALIEETDARGGFLVSQEVANAIVRIAASVGLAMGKITKWPMQTDELAVPAYTGSFLEGEYLGVDAAGTPTALTFGQVSLITKKWQLAFAVGNDLLADASVQLADWLLALGAEALANRVDKEVFNGVGTPFQGILTHPSATVFTCGVGHDTFAEFDPVDASDAIANLEESLLDGAAFYFSRTVWAKLRSQNTSGVYAFGGFNPQIGTLEKQTGIKEAGYILGYPVYTTRHLPANSASEASTKFGIFGNLKAVAYGDKGELRVAQFTSGSFGGKEIALADQTAMVLKHRHAIVVTLGAAFVVIKSAA
ncbi:MAG: phage major capsid protein [bacterium]|nr:phage major capsid protein [bacterium]